jgi:O-Antigen ligase
MTTLARSPAAYAPLARVTGFLLASGLVFGIATMWMIDAWPFVAVETAILLAALPWFVVIARQPDRLPWRVSLPYAVVSIGVAQLAFGQTASVWQTRQATYRWIGYASAAVVAFELCRDERIRRPVLRAFALAAALLALLAVAQYYAAPNRVLWIFGSPDGPTFGPFESHAKLANLAELAMAVALWLAAKERRRAGLYGGAAAVLAASVIASGTRAGAAVILLELVILAVLANRSRGRGIRWILLFAAAVAAAVGVLGWRGLAERLNVDPLRDLRVPILLSSLDMVRGYWAGGSGLGTWATVYPQFARFDVHAFINQAHCDWLQWLIEGGIAFPVCIGLMLAEVFRAARREWWALGLAFVWLHGLFDYPMHQTPGFAMLLVAFWGAAAGVIAPENTPCSRASSARE